MLTVSADDDPFSEQVWTDNEKAIRTSHLHSEGFVTFLLGLLSDDNPVFATIESANHFFLHVLLRTTGRNNASAWVESLAACYAKLPDAAASFLKEAMASGSLSLLLTCEVRPFIF